VSLQEDPAENIFKLRLQRCQNRLFQWPKENTGSGVKINYRPARLLNISG
jgi:hypothetical protein